MTETKTEFHTHLVKYLESLRDRQDRAALAALRRGLGKPPGTVAAVHRYVVPFVSDPAGRWRREVAYIAASLFALHPQAGGCGNLGSIVRSVAKARKIELDGSSSLEKRFSAVLDARSDRMAHLLRQLISQAESDNVPVDWHRLHRDLERWTHPDRYVQRQWAESLWA